MKLLGVLLALALTLRPFSIAAQPLDESKPYGLACATMIDPVANKEAVLGGELTPQPGRLLTVHLDANAAGEAIVVTLTKKDGRLAHGWRPVIVPIKDWEEINVPAAPEKWAWTQGSEPFDVYVVFLAKNGADGELLRKLVAQLRDAKTDASALKTTARQLREELLKWQTNAAALATVPESAPTAIGGTLRAAGEFPWRTLARKANFDSAKPAVVVFHAGAK